MMTKDKIYPLFFFLHIHTYRRLGVDPQINPLSKGAICKRSIVYLNKTFVKVISLGFTGISGVDHMISARRSHPVEEAEGY